MLVSALLEDVAMLHNLHAILSVPGIGRKRARLVEHWIRAAWSLCAARMTEFVICDCAAG